MPVRLIVDNGEYRNPDYLWDAWNVDRLYIGLGVSSHDNTRICTAAFDQVSR